MRKLFLLAVAVAAIGCGGDPATEGAQEPDPVTMQAATPAIVGTWAVDDGAAGNWSLTFATSGALTYRVGGVVDAVGTWAVVGTNVTLVSTTWGSKPLVAGWSVQGNSLMLTMYFEATWQRTGP